MIEAPEIAVSVAQEAAVIRLSVPRDQMQSVDEPAIGELMSAVAGQGVGPRGPMFMHHFGGSPDRLDFDLGVPVDGPVTPTGQVRPGALPAATVVRTAHAWSAVPDWAASPEEFVRRAGYALIWALALHDRSAPDESFRGCLEIIDRGATDERNFVKKAVDMALRAVGRRNRAMNSAAIETSRRLAGSDDRTAAWIGGHALRELESDKVQQRLARR